MIFKLSSVLEIGILVHWIGLQEVVVQKANSSITILDK